MLLGKTHWNKTMFEIYNIMYMLWRLWNNIRKTLWNIPAQHSHHRSNAFSNYVKSLIRLQKGQKIIIFKKWCYTFLMTENNNSIFVLILHKFSRKQFYFPAPFSLAWSLYKITFTMNLLPYQENLTVLARTIWKAKSCTV